VITAIVQVRCSRDLIPISAFQVYSKADREAGFNPGER